MVATTNRIEPSQRERVHEGLMDYDEAARYLKAVPGGHKSGKACAFQ
jgi:hypothetical protein